MKINMEVKKDGLRQTQDGIWKLTLTVLPEDMPVELMKAPMGSVYGLAMVPIDYDNPNARSDRGVGKSEGDKLRIRAVMLCKDKEYHLFHGYYFTCPTGNEVSCRNAILTTCNIKSRSELTTDVVAQEKFKELDQKFKDWQHEQQYKDNLDREG